MFSPLSEAELARVHDVATELLAEYGIQFAHEGATEILADAGCSVEDDTVRMPRSVVEECIDRAPDSFTLFGRGADTEITVGEGGCEFAPAYGPTRVFTPDDGVRNSILSDLETLTKLAHVEPTISCTGFKVCEPTDIPERDRDTVAMKRTLLTTDLPLIGSVYGRRRSIECLELAGIANDDSDLSRPYVVGQVSPVSPRRWPERMVGGLLAYARRGQPLVVMSQPLAGASAPATLAGALALTNAEILSGIVLAQLAAPGSPVVYGSGVTALDMRTSAIAAGAPEGALGAAATAQLASFYELPSRAGGAVTDAHIVDDQSGSESMLNLVAGVAGGVDFMLHAAGILDSYRTVSPEKFLLDCERLRAIRRLTDGIDVSDETLAADLLADVAPDESFLKQRHTVKHARESLYRPQLAVRTAHQPGGLAGTESVLERATQRVETLLDEYERPHMSPETERKIEAYSGHHE